MANYSYQSSGNAAFNRADANRDGRLDRGEFRNFVGQNLGAGGARVVSSRSSSLGGSRRNINAAFEQADANLDGRIDRGEFRSFIGQNLGGSIAGGSAYEASLAGGGFAGFAGGAGAYEAESISGGAGYGGEAVVLAGGAVGAGEAAYEASATQVQQYATDAQGLFVDSNPAVIRRPAVGGVQTYTQNILVRFLQPPPVPPHGPLVIKEVRPVQPPPPPPLRIRQQAPPLPPPPPLILRERPPQPPVPLAAQTVIRRLPGLPVPPRSVIIERLPPLPPRPRDIVIERWVPYSALAKRRTIVQRAPPAVRYPAPRNVIVQYDAVQVRIVRQFQRLGVVAANPGAYLQQYGGQLLDAGTLVQQARAAGVVEDISPPLVGAAYGAGASAFSQESFVGASSGLEAGAGYGAGFVAGGVSEADAEADFVSGGAVGLDAGFGSGYTSSAYESAGYASGGYASGGYGGAGFIGGGADAAFAAADTNLDGTLDQDEFSNFVGGAGIGGASSFQTYSEADY